jgi:hypothetical protein
MASHWRPTLLKTGEMDKFLEKYDLLEFKQE